MDGSSGGNPSDSSVGGVVRDSSGQILVSFSEFIGVVGSNIRVWRGLLICSDLSLFPGSKLIPRFPFRFFVPGGVVGIWIIL